MNLRINFALASFFIFSFSVAIAADDWCYRNILHPPCNGSPGRCTINADGSYGGFVASTATVDTITTCCFWQRNLPYIGISAQVCDNAQVGENARIFGNARIYGNAQVYGNAVVRGVAKIYENARVSGNASINGHANIFGNARVYGNAQVFEYASLYDEASAAGDARIYGNAIVYGNASVYDRARVGGDAEVENIQINRDMIVHDRPNHDRLKNHTDLILQEDGISILAFKDPAISAESNLLQLPPSLQTTADATLALHKAREIRDADQDTIASECPICKDDILTNQKNLIFTQCHHLFCEDCLNSFERDPANPRLDQSRICPFCRTLLADKESLKIEISRSPSSQCTHNQSDLSAINVPLEN